MQEAQKILGLAAAALKWAAQGSRERLAAAKLDTNSRISVNFTSAGGF